MLRHAAAFAALATITAASDEWTAFKKAHTRAYSSPAEEQRRRAIFDANVDLIADENEKGHSWTLGIGPHADLTAAEFMATKTMGDGQPDINWAELTAEDASYLGEHAVTDKVCCSKS